MKFKDGVIVEVVKMVDGKFIKLGMSKEIETAIDIADKISKEVSGKEAVITSVFDGVHSRRSFHYTGYAFDMRTYIYSKSQIVSIFGFLRAKLGSLYDVILEEDHIHIEYDPT